MLQAKVAKKQIIAFVFFWRAGERTMDRKSDGRHRSGRRTNDRRTAEVVDYAGPDRRSGEDRRALTDRRRRPH
jgi:hypothetical protein